MKPKKTKNIIIKYIYNQKFDNLNIYLNLNKFFKKH